MDVSELWKKTYNIYITVAIAVRNAPSYKMHLAATKNIQNQTFIGIRQLNVLWKGRKAHYFNKDFWLK